LGLLLIESMIEQGMVSPKPSWNKEAVHTVTRKVESQVTLGEHIEALQNASLVETRVGRKKNAHRLALKALSMDEDNAMSLYQVGTTASTSEEAISYLRRAVAADPDFAEAHNNLGSMLLQIDRMEEAAQHFAEAVRIKPEEALFHYNLGMTRAARGDLADAESCLEVVRRLDPGNQNARTQLDTIRTLLLKKQRQGT